MNPPPGTLFWEGTPGTIEDFLQITADEQRLIYELAIIRNYGMF